MDSNEIDAVLALAKKKLAEDKRLMAEEKRKKRDENQGSRNQGPRKVRSSLVKPDALDLAPVTDYDTSRCPHCGSRNRGEHVLSFTRTLHYFCKDCFSSWPEFGYRHFHNSAQVHDKVCWQEKEQ